ncbi:hypothetical protein BDZ91DRAFT_755703 [Kalaharituber pfeilii]|nr:hypothetical protein BDZ91DRAFT_755703 [Kalaharituber pfeilii]
MGDDITNKRRKPRWATSYSNMTIREAEKRLGIRMDELEQVPVDEMLAKYRAQGPYDMDKMKAMKEKVYERVLEYLDMEGYPTEASVGFKEANISDLVLYMIGPILSDFKRRMGRNIRLEREKEIISVDEETGGREEFVVMDRIEVTEERFVLIIEAKKSGTGEAMKQCLLSLKDARDNNGPGEVFGFVTTGKQWQMIRYDGTSFVVTEEFAALFGTMEVNEKRWIDNYSDVVDCMYFALSNGGIGNKNVVVG